MSGDQLDLDAIEHNVNVVHLAPSARTVLGLVAEVRRLRAEVSLLDPDAPLPDDLDPFIPGYPRPPIAST